MIVYLNEKNYTSCYKFEGMRLKSRLPIRMKIFNELNLATQLRIVKFMVLETSDF